MGKEQRKLSGAFGNLPGRVFPSESTIRFQLIIQDEFFLENSASIQVKYIRDDWRTDHGSVAFWTPDLQHFWQIVPYTLRGNILEFELAFRGEFEHWLGISAENEQCLDSEDFAFYTLDPDLIPYHVFKGSIHSHSTGSDGLYAPRLVPAFLRRAGFDFMAVTDHHQYTPSLTAIEAMKAFDSGLECYPGEEVENSGAGMVHILSLGASSSVSEWKNDPHGDFAAQADKRKKDFSGLPEHEQTYAAQFETLTAKIHELGGLSVFCHPYWRQNARFAATNLLVDTILRKGMFDALEIGNYNVPRTALMNAKLQELVRECNFRKPLIGSSDWHGRPLQKDNIDYTVIFAKSPRFEDFAEAVRCERCVAVGGYNDEFPFGSFRLVKYTLFLMEHFFRKVHDPLCLEQGELLLKALEGDNSGLQRIAEIRQELVTLRKTFFQP